MPQRPPTLGFSAVAVPRVRERDHRPSSAARGYGARWQRAAKLHLAQHPLCARCESHGRATLAALVDHIRPVHGEGDPLFFDSDNHQSLCRRCHAVKTHADRRAGTSGMSHGHSANNFMDTKPNQPSEHQGAAVDVGSGPLLAGFSPMQREAILAQMAETPVEKFHTISEQQWLKYRGCGRQFLERLKQRGWVEQTLDCGLSVRAQNVLWNANIEPTKENIEEALKSGRLSVESKRKPRNYGLRTHNELRRFVGLPEQKRKARAWKYDPYTGKPLVG